MIHGRTIVDKTIIDAPSSTKNAEGKRDPEMHQTKKGNQWFFGAKLNVGVDAGSGYIYTTIVTAANVHDGSVAPDLIREDDEALYGDSAYCAVGKHENVQIDLHLSQGTTEQTSSSPTASTPGMRAPVLNGSGSWSTRSPASSARPSTSSTSSKESLAFERPATRVLQS